MVNVKKEGVILSKTSEDFENKGVLNPAIYQDGSTLHMFYRAVRQGNYSTIGYCRLEGPTTVVERSTLPVLVPDFDYEAHGVEDPRIVKIDELYYLTFTAYDGVNALGALATSTDLRKFTKVGCIVQQYTFEEFERLAKCNAPLNEKYERFHLHNNIDNNPNRKLTLWDKNVVFFPEKINGKFCFFHRIRPDIQLVMVDDLGQLTTKFWEDYYLNFNKHIVLSSKFDHEISYIGAGCPPIKTDSGWLCIYHGVRDSALGYVYSACAALLDLADPMIEISRLPYPLFQPDQDWELKGVVNNVVFPTGTAVFDDTLYIYYGGADKCIGCASVSVKELLKELIKFKS